MGTKRLTDPYRSVAQGLGIAALIGSFFPGLFGVPRICRNSHVSINL